MQWMTTRLVRMAAFDWLEQQNKTYCDVLPRDILAKGFSYLGQRITLVGLQGIWKSAIMELPISITVD